MSLGILSDNMRTRLDCRSAGLRVAAFVVVVHRKTEGLTPRC